MNVQTTWACIILAIAIFVGWRMYKGGRFWPTGIPAFTLPTLSLGWFGWIPTKIKAYPKVILFAVWMIFLYVAAIVLHPEAAFLLSFKWFGILLLLLVMIAILVIGIDLLKSSWFTVAIFVLLTIAVVDPGLIRNFPDEFKRLFHTNPMPSDHSSIAYGTSPNCDGNVTVLRYDTGNLYKVNPNACQIRAYVMSGCVDWFDSGMLPVGQTCTGGSLPFGIRFMKPTSLAVVRINHCLNNTPGIQVDSCT